MSSLPLQIRYVASHTRKMSHPVDEAISPDELARLNSIPSRILFSADYIDELVLRLLEAVDAAQTRLRSDSAGLVLALAASRADFCSRARRVQRHRSQWYDKQYEEAGAVEKALVATGRALESGGDDWLLASLAEGAAGVLSGCLDMQYRHSCVIDTCGDSFAPDVPSLSRVQGGVCEVLFAGGSGLGWCMAGKSDGARSQNVICVRCVDECGEPVRGVRTEDVSLMVEAGSVFEGSVTVVDGVYECSVYIGDDGAGGSSSCLVKISLLGEVRAEMSLKVCIVRISAFMSFLIPSRNCCYHVSATSDSNVLADRVLHPRRVASHR